MARHSVRPGRFVYTPDENQIGKVVKMVGAEAYVQLRHSAVKVEEKRYALSDLKRGFLHPEMRVFFFDEKTGVVKAGRVRDYFDDKELDRMSYWIRFPNDDEVELDEEVLETRTFLPNPDPADALAAGYAETQFFYDRRMAVQAVLMHARQHSGGLTGLLSASVKLLSHQIAVVWRVLSDPIQRYLLADEVGMGKTIEAGAILRQMLLDDPNTRIVVAVPATLVGQWKREMTAKFHLHELSDQWRVIPFAELAQLSEGDIDVLVLDEAHHLVSPKTGQEQFAYDPLIRIAHAVPRLLLLTATPVLGDGMATLRLLHLLDPQFYPLEDVAGFTRKLERSHEYGRLLIRMMPGLAGFPLNNLIGSLRANFADDPIVVAYAERLGHHALSQDEIDGEIRALKRYLMETYRLHQRLVRNRRGELPESVLGSRKGEVRIEADLNLDEMEVLASALEDWRDAAQRFAADAGDLTEQALSKRYIQLFDGLGEGTDSLDRAISTQRAAIRVGELISFPEDITYLARLQQQIAQLSDPASKLEALVDIIKRYEGVVKHPITGAVKCVLFTTDSESARSASRKLSQNFGNDSVVTVLQGDEPPAVEQAVQRFEEASTNMVLVADRSGEEGLNLQFADALIHLDLPLDAARLEQRIGRVDRLNRPRKGVPQTLVLPIDEEDSPWAAWRELLNDSFDIFSASLSDVQFQLEVIQAELQLRLFRVGAGGLLRAKDWVSDQLSRERDRLEAHHALDKLVVTDDEMVPLLDGLQLGDAPERYEDLNRWLIDAVHFEQRAISRGEPDAFVLHWRDHREPRTTLMCKWPWEEQFASVLEQPHTYRRDVALANLGTRLLRPGARLVTLLEEAIRHDDRGSSFATWRVDGRWPTADRGEWLGFRLSYVIEFDVARAWQLMAGRPGRYAFEAIRRRADALFAPRLETLTLNSDLQSETDPLVEQILSSSSYHPTKDGGTDYNLGSRLEDLGRVMDLGRFGRLCMAVRSQSSQLLQQSPFFVARVQSAVRKAGVEIGTRTAMLQYRQTQLERQTGLRDRAIEDELNINAALLQTVSAPHIRLDAIGCVVISDAAPQQGRTR